MSVLFGGKRYTGGRPPLFGRAMTSNERSYRADARARKLRRCLDCHLDNERWPLRYCQICADKRNAQRSRWPS